jgi:hypothetical protein
MSREGQRGQPARTRRVQNEEDAQKFTAEEPNEDENWSDDANCGDMQSKSGNGHTKPKHGTVPNSHRHRRHKPVLPPNLSDSRKGTYYASSDSPSSFGQAGGQLAHGRPIYSDREPFVPFSQPALSPNTYLQNPHSHFQHPMSHPNAPPTYPYPMGPGPYPHPVNMEPPTLFRDPGHQYFGNYPYPEPQLLPPFGGMPMVGQPPQMATRSATEYEYEQEETRRKLEDIRISQKHEKDQQRALKKQNRAAAQKEAKKQAQEVERLVREEVNKVWQRERKLMDLETQSEPARARAGYDMRGASAYARHEHDDMRYHNGKVGESDPLQEEIARLVEGRKQYWSQRGHSRGSLDAQTRTRLEVRPRTAFDPTNGPDFRDQVEDVVIDILRRLRSNEDEADWLPFLSSPYRTMSDGYPASEGQQSLRGWQAGTYGSKPIDAISAMYSSPRNFSHTRRGNLNDQSPPFENRRSRNQAQDDPASWRRPTQIPHNYRVPREDARFSSPPRDLEAHHNVAREIVNRGSPTNAVQNGSTRERRNAGFPRGHVTAGRKMENSGMPGGPRDTEIHIPYDEGFSDELDDTESIPDRQPAPYAFGPNRPGLEDDFPPPSAPEPPRRRRDMINNN